jgi:predicted enzyme related to lactoylglutathione lyase
MSIATEQPVAPDTQPIANRTPSHAFGVVKFHASLNVQDLPRALAFYRALFGVEPAKAYTDYAKFEVDEPPLILSLKPQKCGKGGRSTI